MLCTNGRSSESLRSAIWLIDLEPIKFKLMDPSEGEGWSREETDRIEEQYRQFLFLSVTREETIVPTKSIDAFWHAHILDTRKYMADCDKAFGYYLHHFPYFGVRSEEDAANLRSAFADTQQIWKQVFGEESPLVVSGAGAIEGANCQANCHHSARMAASICGADCSSCGADNPKPPNPPPGELRTGWRPTTALLQ